MLLNYFADTETFEYLNMLGGGKDNNGIVYTINHYITKHVTMI